LTELISRTARLIREAGHCLAFTGAGISVESGIPPFRGNGGIWEKYDPLILDINYFMNFPDQGWKFLQEVLYRNLIPAVPNPGHEILARLEQSGFLRQVITQNIDGLHQKAGSRNVIEYHGSMHRLICTGCGGRIDFSGDPSAEKTPRCDKCAAFLRPDFVFFGEFIPAEVQVRVDSELRETDLLLVIGTSGEVWPAAQIPIEAKKNGAVIVEINPSVSSYTKSITDIFIKLPVSEFALKLQPYFFSEFGKQ